MPVNSKLFFGEKFKSGAFLGSWDRRFFNEGVFFFDMVNMDEKFFEIVCLEVCV